MNKKLFNIGRLFSILAVVAFMLTACEKDDKSNPTFKATSPSFKLNVPANAANNIYDLVSANGLELTCTQPDYNGVPYVTQYHVQIALSEDFAKFKELETSYTTAKMSVDAYELNTGVIDLFHEIEGDIDYPAEPRPLYIRLRANVVNMANTIQDEALSNIITLPKVLATFKAPELTFPTTCYIVGSSIGDGDSKGYWSYWKPMAPVYGGEGEFYTLIYVPDGGQFKWGEAENDWRGFDRVAKFDDQANAGVHEAANDGNIEFSNGGWYTIHVETALGATEVAWTFHIYPGAAYVIGNAAGGDWTDSNADWLMIAPKENGTWESPAFTASGELRAYIKVPGRDWWKTEFTLYNSDLYFRTVNIPANWAEDVGPEYSVACSAGQKLYVNFSTNTGEVK
jgi:hypothetical protein